MDEFEAIPTPVDRFCWKTEKLWNGLGFDTSLPSIGAAEEDLVQVTFDDGRQLTGTWDHPIAVAGDDPAELLASCITLGNLTVGSTVVYFGDGGGAKTFGTYILPELRLNYPNNGYHADYFVLAKSFFVG